MNRRLRDRTVSRWPNRDIEELSELTDEELAEVREEIDSFGDRVYWLVRQIPAGRVATYGEVATYAGSPRAARAVGQLMKRSPELAQPIPWHRVINARGGISHRGDVGRAHRQRDRLEEEGIVFASDGTCDLDEYRWEPDRLFWEAADD